MSETQYCECCGQRIRKLNPHRMDKSKVAVLEMIAKHDGWLKISTGQKWQIMGDAPVHALRLEMFGLIEHGPRRSGMYRVLPKGIAFLKGEVTVPEVIWCREGRVIEQSSTQVNIHSVKNVVLDKAYWDEYPFNEF